MISLTFNSTMSFPSKGEGEVKFKGEVHQQCDNCLLIIACWTKEKRKSKYHFHIWVNLALN